MKNSKLIELLAVLDNNELNELQDYIESPFFNKNKDAGRLFRRLRKAAPEYSEDKIDRYYLWSKIFPRKAFEPNEWRYISSLLLDLAQKYLGQVFYQNSPLLPDTHILSAIEDRVLDKHYRTQQKRLTRALERAPHQSEELAYVRYHEAVVATKFLHHHNLRVQDGNIHQALHHLDHFHILSKLRLVCQLINQQLILATPVDLRFVEDVKLTLDRQPNLREDPNIDTYASILALLGSGHSLRDFQRLKYHIRHHSERFPAHEMHDIFSHAQNFCIRQINSGNPEYQSELLELYQTGLDKHILIEKGALSPWKFKNIISLGLKLRKFEYVEACLNEYASYLPEEYREGALLYNRANLHFRQGEYETALLLLQKLEFNDVFYSTDTRKVIMMIYYHQRATEPLLSLFSSFRLFLRRNKLISTWHRDAYLHLIELTQLLYRIDRGTKKVTRKEFESQIENRQPLVEEAWIRQQAEEIIGDQ